MNFRALLISVVAVVITAFLIAILLFIADRNENPNVNQVGGLEVAGNLSLNADISVVSITSDESGLYTVTYRYMISNFTETTVYELTATNLLQEEFDPHQITVSSITSNTLAVNPGFNGISDTNLLLGSDALLPGQTETIEVVMQFNPEGDTGPFGNNVEVTATTTDPSNPDSGSEDGSGNQGGDGGSEDPNNDNPEIPGDDGEEPNVPGDPSDDPGDTGSDIDYSNLMLTLWIVDSQTSTRLFELQPGTTIDVGELGSFSIEAVPNQEFEGSVEFIIPNNLHRRVENFSLYMMFGNTGNVSNPWDLGGGTFDLEVRAYPNQNTGGEVVAFETRQFSVDIPQMQGVISGSGSISFTLESSTGNTPSQDNENGQTPRQDNGDDEVLTPAQEEIPPQDNQDQDNDVPFTVGNSGNEPLVNTGISIRKSTILGLMLVLAPLVLNLAVPVFRKKK